MSGHVATVANVVTVDTKRDISALINAAAAAHGFDAVGFLAGLIGESNLSESAVRERTWPDVSYGLSQPTVAFLHPDSGLSLARDPRGVALDTPENRRLVRDWAHDAGNLIPYTARRYAALLATFGPDPIDAWSRWNAPARTTAENEQAQPDVLRNYRNGLAEAQKYRAGPPETTARPTVPPPPGIVWIGSPNFVAGRSGFRPVAIVDHIMEGTLAGSDSWFRNPAAQVSAHFGIGRDGTIHQYVRGEDTAWANGRLNQPDTAIDWIADAVRRGINPNVLTVSIEHEGKSGDAVPERQYQASLALHRYLLDEYAIAADAHHIIGHNRIDAVDRARCPGAGFPWVRLFRDLASTPSPLTLPANLDVYWAELVAIGRAGRDDLATLIDVSTPGNQAIASEAALTEAWRIKGLLEAKAGRIGQLVAALKGTG